MRRASAEAEETDALCGFDLGDAQAAEADHPGAKERGCGGG